MMSPVPTPVASGSLTDIVTLMCASPVVTSTDVADTWNDVRVGRMSARAGPAAPKSAAATTKAKATGSQNHRRTDVGLSVAKLGMRMSLPNGHCAVVPLAGQHGNKA